jgi:hypothetical protein
MPCHHSLWHRLLSILLPLNLLPWCPSQRQCRRSTCLSQWRFRLLHLLRFLRRMWMQHRSLHLWMWLLFLSQRFRLKHSLTILRQQQSRTRNLKFSPGPNRLPLKFSQSLNPRQHPRWWPNLFLRLPNP